MANEEIVAVFKADIEQFKTQMAELGVKIDAVDKKTEQVGTTTQKFSTHSKGAANSIKSLSQGLGGITGLLGITGKLFGVNTDKLEGFIFASREFIKVARDVQHAQHLSNLATEAGTAAKVVNEEATVSLTVAERVLNAVRSAAIPIIGAIVLAIGATAAVLIHYKEQIFGITDAEKEKMKADDGMLIRDEKVRDSHNESTKVLRDLDIEYRLATGAIDEYGASLEKIANKNKDALDKIAKDTKDKLDEAKSPWTLALANQFGLSKLELQKQIDERVDIIKNGKIQETDLNKISEKEKEVALAKENEKIFKIIGEAADEIAKNKKDADDKALKAQEEYNKKHREIEVQDFKEQQADALKLVNENEDTAKSAEKVWTDFVAEIEKINEDAREKSVQAAGEREKQAEKQGEEFAKSAKEDLKKGREDRIEQEKKMLDTIFQAQQEAFDKKKALSDQAQTDQEKAIDVQRALAEKGLGNTLAFEEKRLADLRRQQQQDAEKQKRIKLLETFLNSLAEYSKTDPKTALSKALLQVALATAASAVFAEEGGIIGEIGARSGGRRHKSGRDVLLHAEVGEGIIPKDSMAILGKRNFELMRNLHKNRHDGTMLDLPRFAGANQNPMMATAEIVNQLSSIQETLKNQKQQNINFESYHSGIKMIIEEKNKGIRTKTIKTLPKLG